MAVQAARSNWAATVLGGATMRGRARCADMDRTAMSFNCWRSAKHWTCASRRRSANSFARSPGPSSAAGGWTAFINATEQAFMGVRETFGEVFERDGFCLVDGLLNDEQRRDLGDILASGTLARSRRNDAIYG